MKATPPVSEKSRSWSVWLILGLAVLLALAVSRLFSLRFARGDIYPPYSSLRADPLGTKALADAINELPGFSVQRNYRQLSRLKVKPPMTLVYLGIDYQTPIDEHEFAEATHLVREGTRLIITLSPELARRASATPSPVATPAPAPGSSPAPAATPTPASTPSPVGTPRPAKGSPNSRFIDDRTLFKEAVSEWGVSFDRAEGNERTVLHAKAEPAAPDGQWDSAVPWHTALFFKDLDPAWRTLYRCNDQPVAIERKLGLGSIVLCTDSYFLSNEGLHASRAPKFVAHLLEPSGIVIFDEFHNGVAENSNIAGLARKYGLGGTILALLAVVALFIWKNAVPFLPPQHSTGELEVHVAGIDASAGFVNLLRRGVPAHRILNVCIEEWLKSRGSRIRVEERAHVDAVLRAHEGRSATRNPAAGYRTIAEGLNRS